MADYKVLIGCRNDKTGKSYEPGNTVTDADFPKKNIDEFLSMVPPVLEKASKGATAAAASLADEEGVDLDEVEGTGAGGKVVKSDVEELIEEEV